MDRIEAARWDDRNAPRRAGAGFGLGGELVLPSRNRALIGLRSALEQGRGPLLLSGEAGVGKTWLSERLASITPAEWRWLVVNVSPALDAFGFSSLLLNGFGLEAAPHLAGAQGLIADVLREASADGRRWGLTIEEAHNASPELYEEVRLLDNALGRDAGFSGILLVGQTVMERARATRSTRALEARLAARVHLRPLDLDEFAAWTSRLPGVRALREDEIEFFHRAVHGNPGRFLREIAPSLTLPGGVMETPVRETLPPGSRLAVAASGSSDERPWDVPELVPSKPPLQVAEEMIEVGWDASTEPAPALESSSDDADPSPVEERIDDHYAALQAWNEWAQNQGREADAAPASPEVTDEAVAAEAPNANVRAESEHNFAPYSQLFSRMRAAREP